LPDPLGPRKPVTLPARTSKLSASTAIPGKPARQARAQPGGEGGAGLPGGQALRHRSSELLSG
jgi:hypothetical protein